MIKNVSQIRLSPLFEVTDMLVADKVQNCKDFITYHKATHPRSRELHAYFDNWLDRLEIDEAAYQNFCSLIDQSKPHTIA